VTQSCELDRTRAEKVAPKAISPTPAGRSCAGSSAFDPTALRIRRQKTKRKPCSLAPGHFVETCKRIASADEQHVLLCVERHRVQASDRLVVDVGNANIDRQIFQLR